MQNISHAVMSQRIESRQSLDDFPTPPWATRALLHHLIDAEGLKEKSCLEPACGRGYMAEPLGEFFGSVDAFDVHPYGYAPTKDFLDYPFEAGSHDWVITNPPFKLAEEFIERALVVAQEGVAILARTVFLESAGRYRNLFSETPPTVFGQFVERVPMVKGRLDKKASTATGYAWFVWEKTKQTKQPRLAWIPPCRKQLEKQTDYS